VPKRMFVVPGDLRRKAVAQHGEEGRAWIERLPIILEHCRQQWNLTCASPVVYPSNAAHYLAQARRRDGTTVVLKAHAPTGEFLQEAEALRLCAGRGMARLLDADMSNQALLLEQLSPGTPLSQVEDDERAISIAATVMRDVWRPVPSEHPFPSLIEWGRSFLHLRQRYDGGSGPFPAPLLEEAETLLADLSASMTQRVVLHGDLHRSRAPRWLDGISPTKVNDEKARAPLREFQEAVTKELDRIAFKYCGKVEQRGIIQSHSVTSFVFACECGRVWRVVNENGEWYTERLRDLEEERP